MKIIALQCSPRKRGNTAILLSQFVNGAEAEGSEVETITMQEMNIHPCDMCDMCDCGSNEFCVYNDSMRDSMASIDEADAIVFATPVWWTGASALMKHFLDRLYGFKTRKYFQDKGAYLITTNLDNHVSDQPLPGTDIVGFIVQSVADFTGMDFIGHLRCMTPGSVLSDTTILDKAYTEGKRFSKVIREAGK